MSNNKSMINNWDVYTQRNWDSKGREKLISAFDKIIEDFPETTVGSQLFSSIENLENDVSALEVVRPKYYGTMVDVPLSSSGNTDIDLGIFFTMEDDYIFRRILFNGQILVTPSETDFGMLINASAPIYAGGGFSRLIDFDNGGVLVESHGSGTPSISISGSTATRVLWDFSFIAEIDAVTTFDLRCVDVGGAMNQGSWVKAVHVDGVRPV